MNKLTFTYTVIFMASAVVMRCVDCRSLHSTPELTAGIDIAKHKSGHSHHHSNKEEDQIIAPNIISSSEDDYDNDFYGSFQDSIPTEFFIEQSSQATTKNSDDFMTQISVSEAYESRVMRNLDDYEDDPPQQGRSASDTTPTLVLTATEEPIRRADYTRNPATHLRIKIYTPKSTTTSPTTPDTALDGTVP